MFRFLYKRLIRRSLNQLVGELFVYNDKDACYDPVGSIDRKAMLNLINVVSDDKLTATSAPRNKLKKRSISGN